MNKHLKFSSAATIATISASVVAINAQESRMNIIHIMCDDLAFQAISAYGHPFSQLAPTPNIDRLAQNGMIFTRAYVENSISTPSRATLLTGKYSHQHGQTKLGKREFFDGQRVFPKLLQEVGYQTALIGKWHIDMEPYGFDYYKILNGQGTYYNPMFKTAATDGKYIREEGYAAELITTDAIEWLEQRDKQRPFCLMVHHKAPHRNWMPEEKYYHLFDDIAFPVPDNLFDDYATRCSAARTQEMRIEDAMTLESDLKVWKPADGQIKKGDFAREFSRMTPKQQQAWLAAYTPRNEAFRAQKLSGRELVEWKYRQYVKDYLRCVRSVDDHVGRLLDYVDSHNLSQNTLIVFTSDQGFYIGEHGWFDKRFMYEESFRTPLIICYPNVIAPGSVCSELVQNIDFAPTYLSIADVEIPSETEGVSLMPLFDGSAPKNWRKDLYYHYYDYPAVHMVRRHDGVITRDYKLIHFYGDGGKIGKASSNKQTDTAIDAWEFYDLRNDPSEMHNIYGDKNYQKEIKRLKKRLTEYRKKLQVEEF